jgi:hypothetical protein|tara:strand:- start:895 stop:1725 length:831 start_codon:yes stop_codon:yes gene_type:complete
VGQEEIEPTHLNIKRESYTNMPSMKQLFFAVLLGVGGGFAYQSLRGSKENTKMSADGETEGDDAATESPDNSLWGRIQKAVSQIRPSQLEELSIERTGTTMDIYPQSFDPAFVGSNELTTQSAARTLNMSPYGTGVIDYQIVEREAYGTNLSAEDFQANAVGQEALPSNQVPMAYNYPSVMGAPCRLPSDVGMDISGNYEQRPGMPSRRGGDFARLSTVYMTTDNLGPDVNSTYSDGSSTKSLEEWRRGFNLTPVSDETYQAISRNGGPRIILRRQ